MLLLILLICFVVVGKLFIIGDKGSLISNYSLLPLTTEKRVHIVITLSPLANEIIEKILKQTGRSDMISIIVPPGHEIKDELIRNTCLVQTTGGYGMLAKEKSKGTIIVFIKNKPNVFLSPDTLKTIVEETERSPLSIINLHDAVVMKSSIKIGVDDAYRRP